MTSAGESGFQHFSIRSTTPAAQSFFSYWAGKWPLAFVERPFQTTLARPIEWYVKPAAFRCAGL